MRRLKTRLPLATRAKVLAPRLAIVVVTNLWLSPTVLAQYRGSPATFTLVEENRTGADSNVFSRTYTKEELNQKVPENPTPDFAKVVQDQVSNLLQSMTQQQSKGKLMEIYNGAAAKNKSDFALYAAAMRDDRLDLGTDGDKLRNYVAGELQTTASDKVVKSNDLLAKLKTGFGFNLDLANIFSKKKKPEQGTVRYGLILQDINPDRNAPPRAAIGESVEDQMAYAGRAEVLWTIGPINEESSKPFSEIAANSATVESSGGSIVDRIHAPSGKFKAKVDPASADSIKAGANPGIPGLKFTMTQEQGLYELMYQTKNNFEKEKMEHQLKAPLVGEFALGRRYNDNFEVIQTSAFNVLVDKRAPSVNIHYLNLEDRYTAEVKKTKDRHEFSAGAEMPTGWKPDSKLGKEGEKYKAEYKFSF